MAGSDRSRSMASPRRRASTSSRFAHLVAPRQLRRAAREPTRRLRASFMRPSSARVLAAAVAGRHQRPLRQSMERAAAGLGLMREPHRRQQRLAPRKLSPSARLEPAGQPVTTLAPMVATVRWARFASAKAEAVAAVLRPVVPESQGRVESLGREISKRLALLVSLEHNRLSPPSFSPSVGRVGEVSSDQAPRGLSMALAMLRHKTARAAVAARMITRAAIRRAAMEAQAS